MGVFNTLEAAIRFGVPRFVNVSSETVPGFFFPERPCLARLRAGRRGAPDPPAGPLRDRQVLLRAADGRGDAPLGHPLPHRSARPGCSGRATTSATSARSCAIRRASPSPGFWAYIDVYDLADSLRLAAESDLDTHEVFYIASPDNSANRPLADLIRHHHGDASTIREPLPRPDASGSVDREGAAAARLRPDALLARLPRRGRDAARRRPRARSSAATPASSAGARSARRRSPRSSAGPRPAGARWDRRARPRRPRPGRASRARAGRRRATRASRGARSAAR